MPQKNISISQVAPLVGLDAYNNFPRIVCELWRRYWPEDYKLIETKLKSNPNIELATSSEMNDIWEADVALGTNILDQVKALNLNKDKSSGDMVKTQDNIKKIIDEQTGLTQKQKDELAKKVCSVTNKAHGVNNEDDILAEFCRLSEKSIKDTQGWLQLAINPDAAEDKQFHVVGKYDAITTDSELVEAKMRQKCLFKKVRDYENVQVQLYLHILEFEQAFLVESYTNKKGKRELYVNEVKYDCDYAIELIQNLNKFMEFFQVFLEDETMKEKLLAGDKDRSIYNMYESQYLGIERDDF